MNLFLREMKKNRTSFLIWLILMILVNAMMLTSFGSVAEMAENTEAMLSQYPKEFVEAMNLDILKMTNILHFYASRTFLLVTILGSVYAIMLTSNIISKEESDKTIEFLISKPISRVSIISSKLSCSVVYITMFNFLFSFANLILLNVFKTEDFSIKAFLLISVGAWLINMIFGLIGLVISAFSSKTRTNISLGLGLVFIGYFLSLMATLIERLNFLKYLTPFSYYNTEDLVINMKIEIPYLIITLVLSMICIAITYYGYTKRILAPSLVGNSWNINGYYALSVAIRYELG